MIQFFKSAGLLLGVVADVIIRAIAFKRIRDEQKEADTINVDPAGEFMRRFKKGQTTTKSFDKTES